MIFRKILDYLNVFAWKKQAQEGEKSDFLKAMHWINRISILLFLVAMIVLLVKKLG